MKQLFNPFNNTLIQKNLFSISLFATFITCFILHEASKLVSFELTDISSIYISEATAHGIDVGSRVSWMYRFLFLAAVLFTLSFFLLNFLFRKRPILLIKQEELLWMSAAGTVLCVMKIFGTDSTHVLSSLFFLFISRLFLLFISVTNNRTYRIISRPTIFYYSIVYAFFALLAIVFLFGSTDLVYKNYSSIFFVVFLFFYALYFFSIWKFPVSSRKISGILLPLSSVPIISFLSVEFYFYKKLNHAPHLNYPDYFSWGLIISTGLIYAIEFFWRKKLRLNSKSITSIFIPSLLLAYTFLTAYEPLIQPIPDMFEPANIMNSVMRVYNFSQVPILDFISSHMFSEQWGGYIYSFIFGFHNDLSPLTYGFLYTIVILSVQYIFLVKLFKRPAFAISFIFLFPFVNEIFFQFVIVAVLPFILFQRFAESPSAGKVLKLLLLLTLLFVWRIDSGVVAIIGTIIFLPVYYFITGIQIPFGIILKGALYFSIIILALFLASVSLRGMDTVLERIQLFYHYISASQAHGFSSLFPGTPHQFFLFHILYPALSLGIVLYSIYILKAKNSSGIFKSDYLLISSIYLFILYFVHLQRGLVRHGFPEFNDDYIISVFYLSLSLFFTYIITRSRPGLVQNYVTFYFICFLTFITIKYFSFNCDKIALEKGFTESKFYNQAKPFDSLSLQGRMIYDSAFANNNYIPLKGFMDKYLKPQQTFFDFSNSSMLYFYCNRYVPGYFNQNLQNSVDDFLQFKLLKELGPEKVPMAIYSHYPPGNGDMMDGIPNIMRHYILAEHIYDSFVPLGVINGKSVWVTPKLAATIKDTFPQDEFIIKRQNFNYELNAEYLGYYFTKKKPMLVQSICKSNVQELKNRDEQYCFKLPNDLDKTSKYFLSVNFKKLDYTFKPYPVYVTLLNDSIQPIGSFSFDRRDKVSNSYFLRLNNHYLWYKEKVLEILVSKDKDIESIELYKDNRNEYQKANIN